MQPMSSALAILRDETELVLGTKRARYEMSVTEWFQSQAAGFCDTDIKVDPTVWQMSQLRR